MKKKFVVIGSSDARFGDFLINHWGKSLINAVDKKLVDIVVLNYGLTDKQKKGLLAMNIKIVNCVKDGHIVNLRYRDILAFLRKNKYEQVMACDSGDIIFQKNIMNLFYKNSDKFRAVEEGIQPPTLEYSLAKASFSQEIKKDIIKVLTGKKMVNGGMVVAPAEKFRYLCRQMLSIIKRMDSFGPDQIVLNYVLYKRGFINLGETFNYIPVTAKQGFKVMGGVFYSTDNKIIEIVHNAGNYDIFRIIRNFGYGEGFNTGYNMFTYFLLRIIYLVIGVYRNVKASF